MNIWIGDRKIFEMTSEDKKIYRRVFGNRVSRYKLEEELNDADIMVAHSLCRSIPKGRAVEIVMRGGALEMCRKWY